MTTPESKIWEITDIRDITEMLDVAIAIVTALPVHHISHLCNDKAFAPLP